MSTPSDDEIRVLLTADAAQLQEGMDQGAASVQSSAEAMQASIAQEAAAFNASVQSKIDAQVHLNTAFAGGITSTAQIAEAEAALDQAMAAGAVTANEYSGYIAQVDAAESAMASATEASTAAVAENTVALTVNSRAAAEIGILMGELASGNASRMKRSFAALANQTGLLTQAVNFVFSPLGALTIALAGLAYEVIEAGKSFDAMEGSVIATGGAAGYTAGQLMQMSETIGESTGNIKQAREAIQQLAESGRFSGDSLRLVGQSAAEMASMTGESVSKIISQITRLQEDPLKAVAALNDQFHFLTVAEYQEMEQLAASGDKMGAAKIAYEAMSTSMASRTDEVHEHVNVLIKAFDQLKIQWSQTMEGMNVAMGGGDDAEKINVANELLSTLKKQQAEAKEMGSSTLPGITLAIQRQQQVVDGLTAKFHAQAQAAASVGQAAQKSAAQIDAMAKTAGKKGSANHEDHDAAQADRDAYNEQRLQHNLSLADEKKFWEEKFAAAKHGTQEYRQAVEQLLQLKQKEATAGKEAAREEESANHKAAEEDKRAAEESASMHAEVVKELQKEAAEHERVEQITEASSEKHAERQIKLAQQIAEDQYRTGQLSAQQLIAVETSYVNQKYQLELDEFKKEQELHTQEPVALANIQAQVLAATDKHNADLQRVTELFHKTSEGQWNQYAQRIQGSVTGAINGMIFQHLTLRNAAAQVAESMAETFIAQEVKQVIFHQGAEQAKTAATLQAAFAREATETAAAIKSIALSAETAAKQIMMAGWQVIANTWQAISAIPVVGPFLAPAMAIAAGAEVFNLASNVSSAAGGWERVPFDGAMTELHKDEMVLPAHIANPVRDMATKGRMGGGGDNHYHFNTMDSRSFEDTVRRNEAAFARVAVRAARNGRFLRQR